MKRYKSRQHLTFYAALIAALLLASCGKKEQRGFGGMEQTVSVATVADSTVTFQRDYPATLVSNKQIKLVTDVGGRVEAILFKEGSHVVKGQPLYDIDKSLYEAAYNEAIAQLKAAQTNLSTAETDEQRYQNLWDHNAVNEIQLAHAKAQVKVSQANVNSAQAAVDRARINMEHATVVAPFSGSTNVSNVRLGDLVVPNQTVLVTIVDNSSMRADFHIPQGEYVEMFSKDNGGGMPDFSLILPDGAVYPFPGKLDFVDNTVDPTTGTILVRLIFPNHNDILKSGMSCVIRSQEKNTKQKYLVIPPQAVQQVLNEFYVYVVNDSGVVVDQKIVPGRTANGVQIVKSGLQQGQKVIVEGIEKVRPHQHVKTVPYGTAGTKPAQNSKPSGKK